MKESKNIVIGLLCAVICVMAVAYAAFSTTLTINGTGSIESKWEVAITGIDCNVTPADGGVEGEVTKSFSGTKASFEFKFKQPGDKGKCTVTIKNSGTLDAKVDSISETATDGQEGSVGLTDDLITYKVSGITNGAKLTATDTTTYVVDAEFKTDTATAPTEKTKTKKLEVTINYVQDLSAGA